MPYDIVLQKSVGTWGLTGLDRLLSFMIVKELQMLLLMLQRDVLRDKGCMDMLAGFSRTLNPTDKLIGLYLYFLLSISVTISILLHRQEYCLFYKYFSVYLV